MRERIRNCDTPTAGMMAIADNLFYADKRISVAARVDTWNMTTLAIEAIEWGNFACIEMWSEFRPSSWMEFR